MKTRISALLLGTALTAAGAASLAIPSAMAADKLSIKLGGYSSQYLGYTSQENLASGEFTGIDIKSDTEVFFQGETTLDNGISVGINIQLEGNTSSDQIDESYLTVSGRFGQLIIGGENSAMYKLHTAPEDFGFGLNSGDNVDWITFDGVGGDTGASRGPFAATSLEPGRVNDANRFTYFTPKIGGFQFGASYVPDAAEDSNSQANRAGALHDGITVAIQYSHDFNNASFGASAGYGFMQSGDDTTSADPTAYSFGVSLGVGAWTLAGAYAHAADDPSVGDMTGYTVGLNYEPGPWKVGLSAFFGHRDGSDTANAGGSGAREANYDTIQLETSYPLGQGIKALGVCNGRCKSLPR